MILVSDIGVYPQYCGENNVINHPPVITIFIGDMVTIPSHGWFMTLF